MSGKVYIGDVGTVIELDMQEDISSSTSITFRVKKPDDSIVTWVPSIYGTDYLRYTLVADDIDLSGIYYVQPHMTLGGWVGYGKTVKLEIYSLSN